MAGLSAVGLFLISVFFELVILVLWLRIAMGFIRLNPFNAFYQLILKLTNPIIGPVSTLARQKNQAANRYDWVTFCILIVVELLKILCIGLLAYHVLIPILLLILFVVAELIIQPANLLFYAILFRVIMSYANPNWRHPAAEFLFIITEPLLSYGRKIVPNISGFDFSPFIILLILKVITLFISSSLPLPIV